MTAPTDLRSLPAPLGGRRLDAPAAAAPRLTKSLLSAYGGYAFRSLYLLLLIPLYARTLGPAAYGLVLAAMAAQNIVWSVQNWGFSFAGARNLAATSTDAERQAEFSRQITGRLLLMPVAALVGLGAILASPLLAAHPLVAGLAVLCGVISGFNLGWYFQGRFDFTTPVLIEGAGCLLTLGLVAWLVRGPADAPWVMAALLAQGVLTSAWAYGLARRHLALRPSPWREGLVLLKQAAPLFINGGAAMLMAVVGTYALSALSTPEQVMQFGTAEKVVMVALGLLGPAGQVLMPWFSRQLSQAGPVASTLLTREQRLAVRVVCLVGAVATVLTLTVMPSVLSLWLGPRFEGVGQTMRWLSPLFLIGAFNSAMAIYVLVPRGLERALSQVSVGMALIGVLAVFGAAALDGARGAAVARVVCDLGVGLACVVLLRRDVRRAAERSAAGGCSPKEPR
ncbi:lipopolysaccharide biosynthesis protein [Ideonella sp. A 288]|uniref:lipopolysaccharide biosynthesis protein n=1 Tax=Ideonella sp. A 288 TaxID=1962181 RepID=UPI001303A0A5|nr:oligosaccharide flippase family protein [Ideonella sp. A 288]